MSKKYKLGELLTQIKEVEYINNPGLEKYITVSGHGHGAKERIIKEGKTPVPFSAYRVKSGQLIYSRIGASEGAFAIIPLELNGAVVSKDFPVFNVHHDLINIDYLIYYLTSSSFCRQVAKDSFGATMTRFKENQLLATSIDIPSLKDQSIRSEQLNRINKVISLYKLQCQHLDDLVKSRFVEMFGDIISNSKKWPQYVFSDIASSRLGKMLDAKQQTGRYKYPYLANSNVQWFRFELENLNEMDFDEADQVEFQLKDGDLLVCEGGEIGRCAVWHNEVQLCFFQKALHRVRCNTEMILPDYLARWFQYNCEHGGFASIEGAKATIAHLPGAKLKLLKVTVPPIDLQEKFVSFITQVDKSKFIIQQSIDESQKLFDSLMQEYFG